MNPQTIYDMYIYILIVLLPVSINSIIHSSRVFIPDCQPDEARVGDAEVVLKHGHAGHPGHHSHTDQLQPEGARQYKNIILSWMPPPPARPIPSLHTSIKMEFFFRNRKIIKVLCD